jgi:hypothetical protein
MDDLAEKILEKIGFLDIAIFESKNVFRGGLLITDVNTYPLEFRVTSSIRPTSLQRMLYGHKLEDYIFVDLIAYPLIKAMKSNPLLVVVSSKRMLDARPQINVPLIFIKDGGENPELETFNGYESELQIANTILNKVPSEILKEPFSRVQAALAEAHKRQIGEKK